MTGRNDAEKDVFWQLLGEKTCHVPADDYIIIANDLNGYVGETADGSMCLGGKEFGTRNEGGERIVDFADTHHLVLMNTCFVKSLSHLPTFYSENSKTRPLIAVLRVKPPIKQHE